MNQTPKGKKRWRILRRILITLAVFATLIALLYTEEDWRGKHDWEAYKQKWEAKGGKFDWQAFVPPAVPNDQNFFTAPIFTNMLNGKIEMTPYHSDGSPDLPSFKDLPNNQLGYMGGEGPATIINLKAWQASYRHPTNEKVAKEFPIARQPQTPAADVLFALSKFNSAIEELRQASRRPYAYVPLPYQEGISASASALLPYLAVLKQCSQTLQLRTVAELADGQIENALGDVKLMLYLNDSLSRSPFLISYLVRLAITAIDLSPIWEGLAEQKWSDKQLTTLEAELSKLNFLGDYEFVMRGERAFAIKTLETQRITREYQALIQNHGTNQVITVHFRLTPSAYFYQSELAIARMQQELILPLVNTNSRTVSPEALRRADETVRAERKHYSLYRMQALMLYPAYATIVKKLAVTQSSVDLARVACALERYRLARGAYPETLDALAPQFIEKVPHDIIGGGPLHYRRTQNGKFLLYSVGWNETDDGGKVAFTKNGSVDREKGDWVWKYPTK